MILIRITSLKGVRAWGRVAAVLLSGCGAPLASSPQLDVAPSRPVSASTTTDQQGVPKASDRYGLRPLPQGLLAPDEQIRIAESLLASGWQYQMPRPKSEQAAWGNTNGRTTWWSGYWINRKLGRTSKVQPSASDSYRGDGEGDTGWHRGGSPPAPSLIEWLCSEKDGIAPSVR